LNDLNELKYIKVDGAIIGKAIYENRIKPSELKNFNISPQRRRGAKVMQRINRIIVNY